MTLAPEEQSSAKILVPVSTFVDKARLFKALQALSTKNPLVVLFRLVEIPRQTTPLDPDLWKDDIKEAEDFLAKPAMWLRSEGYRVENKVVTARDSAEGIIAEANNGGYTVVLLTKRRIRSGWGRIFHKSISEEVIRYTNTLVLTFLAEPQVEDIKR